MSKWFFLLLLFIPSAVNAETSFDLSPLTNASNIAEPLRIVFGLTLMTLIPLFLVATTSFTRFIIVFSMLRFALGLQQTPPNIVLISLSIFLSIFVMSPTIAEIEETALTPMIEKQISEKEFIDRVKMSSSRFMIQQVREEDLALIYRLGKAEMPTSLEETSYAKLVPAFLLSELRTAFKIAFVIFLPFLMIDLVVSSILMSLGMIMVPPTTISLPIKVMLFVVLDGWNLISESLVLSITT